MSEPSATIGRFEGPTPAYPSRYPAWRWGRLWDTARGEGIEWSIGLARDRPLFHFMFAKGGRYRESVACRVCVKYLFTFFVEIHLPWRPRPFEFFVDTNPWGLKVGRPLHA